MHRRILSRATLLLLAVLLLSPLMVGANEPLAPVDPAIWHALDQQGQAKALVILKEQADLSGALALKTKTEKGWYVYRQLTAVAERTQPPLRAYLEQHGVEYRAYWIRNAIRIQTNDPALVLTLAGRPEVARIEIFYPDEFDPVQNLAAKPQDSAKLKSERANLAQALAIGWNLERIRADDVWGLGFTGSGIVVGIPDSGVDWDHPGLINSYRPWVPGAPTRHDYNWYDGPGGSQVPVDHSGHGTAMAGLVSGDDGGVNQTGVAPGAHWIACTTSGGNSTGMDCLQFMLAPTRLDGSDPRPDLAPHVLTNSWRARAEYEEIIHTLYMAGIMFVKAAENETDCGTVIPPGHLPEVTAVGAFQDGDIITSYSSRGPMLYNGEIIIKPNLAAPGQDCPTTYPGGGYGTSQGTSSASPHVAGTVALILSARPDLAGRIDTLQMILQETAEPMIDPSCPPNDPSGVPNNTWGHGILNAYDAVQMALGLGMGDIQGQVSDSGTGQPIPLARIRFEDNTGRQLVGTEVTSGVYTHTLPASTYTVTVETYGYYPGVVGSVSVISGGLTIQNVSLTAKPAYVISGTISGDGTPLSATVTVRYTPLAPVETDPATGFYSVTVAAGSHTLRVASFQRLSEERPIVADRDQTQSFSLTAIPYIPYENNPVLELGSGGAWDSQSIVAPSVVYVDGTFYLFYLGSGPGNMGAIGYASSTDGVNFTKYAGNPILAGDGSGFDADYAGYPAVWVDDGTWTIYYTGWASGGQTEIGRATALAPYGPWSRNYNPVLSPGSYWEWDGAQIYSDNVVRTDSGYALYYTGDSYPAARYYIGMATSPDGLVWTKYNDPGTPNAPYAESDPVLSPGLPDTWDYRWILRSSVRQTAGGWEMLYGGFDPLLLSSAIGYATSPDGIHWTKEEYNPILHPKDEPMAAGYLLNASVVQGGLTDWLYYDGRDNYEDSWHQMGVATRTIYQPAIVVEPLVLEAALYPAEQLTQTLWISNGGNMDLTFQLNELSRTLDYDLDWLSEEPMSGTVAPDGGIPITVTFDAAGLTPGVYLGQLDVQSNDPANPHVYVPVTLTVVSPCEPVHDAGFGWTPVTPTVGDLVTFTASATGTAPITYSWKLEVGSWKTGPVVTHTYDMAGMYTVVLTATNCGTATATVAHTLTVLPVSPPCEPVHSVLFDWTPLVPVAGQVVTFTGEASGTLPITYSWKLDVGSWQLGAVVTHSYTFPGLYTITLTATNCVSATAQASAIITVLPEPVAHYSVYLPLVSKKP